MRLQFNTEDATKVSRPTLTSQKGVKAWCVEEWSILTQVPWTRGGSITTGAQREECPVTCLVYCDFTGTTRAHTWYTLFCSSAFKHYKSKHQPHHKYMLSKFRSPETDNDESMQRGNQNPGFPSEIRLAVQSLQLCIRHAASVNQNSQL